MPPDVELSMEFPSNFISRPDHLNAKGRRRSRNKDTMHEEKGRSRFRGSIPAAYIRADRTSEARSNFRFHRF